MIIMSIISNFSAIYSSFLAFWFGIYFEKEEKNIVKKINNKNIIFLLFIFIFLFVLRLIISKFISNLELLHAPFRNLISIVFCLLIISFLTKYKIKSKIFELIGKFSYELYIVHPLIIIIFSNVSSNSPLLILLVIIVYVIAYFINCISNKIETKLLKQKSNIEKCK